jgi:phage tail-like protein
MKADKIENLLPGVFQKAVALGQPLRALIEAMEALHERPEAILAGLDTVVDPRRTPDAFVPMLASWVDLDWLFSPARGYEGRAAPMSLEVGALRRLVRAAALLSQSRGTLPGLREFLRLATGSDGFVLHEGLRSSGGADVGSRGRTTPFHLWVEAPESTRPLRTLIERIIESEKPAYLTYELTFRPDGPGGS